MKKIIFLLVATLLLFSAPIIPNKAFAESVSDNLVLQMLNETYTDSKVEINVRLVTNTGFTGMTLELNFNREVFKYVGYQEVTKLTNVDFTPPGPNINSTSPVRFLWESRTANNNKETGILLKLTFNLYANSKSGSYEIGFKCKDGDITYNDTKTASRTKSAIIIPAVVKIAENKIAEVTEGSTTNVALIIGIVSIGITATAVTIFTVIRIKRKKGKKNWLKI